MATIRTSIQVDDRMSGAFRAMNNALNIVISSFDSLQDVTHNAVDVSSLEAARAELARAEVSLNAIEQDVQNAANAQERFNQSLSGAGPPASNLLGKIKQIGVAIGGFIGIKKALDLSDTVSQTTARLDLMNDGLQSTEDLQKLVYQAAQRSRGAYQDTANTVARLGITAKDAFSSNAEAITFAEQLNKHFVIGGANAQEMSAVSLQISQALGSGVLRGDELNSVFEQAPTIIQTIADYLDVPIGKIRDMASDGEISADIVKNAMLAAAEETNAKFESMPMTFGQVVTNIQNKAQVIFDPLFERLSELANSDDFNKFSTAAINAMYTISNVAVDVISAIAQIGAFINNNWSAIEPILFAVAGAMIVYYGTLIAINTAESISAGIKMFHAAQTALLTGATWGQVTAQYGLNRALLACPYMWIAMAIGIVIALVYRWIQSVGGLKVAWLIVQDKLLTIWENLKIDFMTLVMHIQNWGDRMKLVATSIQVNFSNAMALMKASVLTHIQNMVNGAIDLINKFITTVNKIPGVSLETIQHVTFATTAKADALETVKSNNDYLNNLMDYNAKQEAARQSVIDDMKADAMANQVKRLDAIYAAKEEAANKGADGLGLDDYLNNSLLDSLGTIADNTGSTKDSSGRTADNTETSTEDLKYLRDIAERETINRFTTAEIKVDVGGVNNTVNNNADLDGIADYLAAKVEEQMQVAAEGDWE